MNPSTLSLQKSPLPDIFQIMPISGQIGCLIMEGGDAIWLAEQARCEGVSDLHASGLRKVREGITSLEEIDRVT